MATMKWTGQRHRGACSITEAPIERRKFSKPRRNTSQAAFDRFRAQEHESAMKADLEAFEAFCADMDAIALGAKGLTIEALKNIHRRALPVAYKSSD